MQPPAPPAKREPTAEEKAAAAAAAARAEAATATLPQDVQDVLQLHASFLEEAGEAISGGTLVIEHCSHLSALLRR